MPENLIKTITDLDLNDLTLGKVQDWNLWHHYIHVVNLV